MKKFIVKCLFTIFPVMLVIYACGFYLNFYLTDKLINSGDLGKLGYIYIDKSNQDDLSPQLSENRVDEYNDTIQDKYRIMTIGDSFSQQGITGYQNYLATNLGERILNYPSPLDQGFYPEEMAMHLLNNDIYNKLGCKIVIIEAVEREFVQRILNYRALEQTDSPVEQINKQNKISSQEDKPKKEKPVQKNKDYLIETFKYFKYQLYKSKRPVREAMLDADCFSAPPYNTLYFYKDDLLKLSLSPEERSEVLERLNHIHQTFQKRGIQLYYMIAPDKYDTYLPHIVNNPYQPKIVLDQLEEDGINELEWFINPRDTLREMISNGVKDVYHIDDTHWTIKASEAVGNVIANKIQTK
ncbi:hypothetical protein [Bacteroides sp.]|uniref:alginate O-acetyltransferase AlgX-related protein n=1 Tax=Bacteroides sp. TaxID=29523 RepID=UPI002636BCA9|nr:hypothetical protein [Bacteroides sp.]MDD3036342.1 hypothetical protein [Bacteroides sp.]